MSTRKNHKWTNAELIGLHKSVHLSGIPIAARNFSRQYGYDYNAVYNMAYTLKRDGLKLKKNEVVKQKEQPIDVQHPVKPVKTDKITVMVGKEYMNKLKIEFSEGKMTIMYPKEDQLDIKFL